MADNPPDRPDLFERLLMATGFLSQERLNELKHRHPSESTEALVKRLHSEGSLSDEQLNAITALQRRPSVQSAGENPLLLELARLKSLTQEGQIDAALDALDGLSDNVVYARLGSLILRKACIKDTRRRTSLQEIERRIEQQKRDARRATTEIEARIMSKAQNGFQDFVELKKAVKLGDLKRSLELEKNLRENEQYGRAAFQLAQKILLNKAIAENRRSDLEAEIKKCEKCSSAYALRDNEKTQCALCGASVG